MKKVLVFILLCLPFCFFGCTKKSQIKLDTPQNLAVEDDKIIFERVENAGHYLIKINDLEISATAEMDKVEIYTYNSVDYFAYDAKNMFEVGLSYEIKVQALADGKRPSDFAELTYLHRDKLATPTQASVQDDGLTWAVVDGAEDYLVETTFPNGQIRRDTATQNTLDLSEILTFGGLYSFKIYAQTSNENLARSRAVTISFEHFVTLQEPTDLIVKDGNELELSVRVDGYANAVVLSVNEAMQTVQKQNANVQVSGDVWKINLSKLAAGFGGDVDFSVLGNYTFSVQATYITSAKNYYTPSDFSQNLNFVHRKQLAAPQVNLVKEDGMTFVLWSSNEMEHVSGFKVAITTGEGVMTHIFDANVSRFVLPEDYLSVSVSALGVDLYTVSNPTTVEKI